MIAGIQSAKCWFLFAEICWFYFTVYKDLFNIEKTMQKVKNKALDEIILIDAFENKEEFEQMARAYKSPRTFITMKKERVDRIKNRSKRKDIADMLKIEISDEGKFEFTNEEEVSRLIRYLCFKLFKDYETKELLEANNVTEIEF